MDESQNPKNKTQKNTYIQNVFMYLKFKIRQ